MENNVIELIGTVRENFKYLYNAYGENFYELVIDVKRSSGTIDTLKLVCSDRVTSVDCDITGYYVDITGSIRTRNIHDESGSHLSIYIFIEDINILDLNEDVIGVNDACLTGFICKNTGLRDTPLKRTICDIIIAVNRMNGTSDYIPCICWGKTAKYVSNLDIGTKIKVKGRFQSRTYIKEDINKVAYELSAQTIEIIE